MNSAYPVYGPAPRLTGAGVPRERAIQKAGGRAALIGVAVSAGLASLSGTLLFCYPALFGPWRSVLILIHNATGDAAVLFSGIYLFLHLPRVWPLRRFGLSWWTGVATAGVWLVAAATGVYGQVGELRAARFVWHAHAWSSLLAVVIACFHGAWGFRPRRVNTASHV